jgi:hypothetical protein
MERLRFIRFRVQGLEFEFFWFEVCGLGFRVQGSGLQGFRGLGFSVTGIDRALDLGSEFKIGFRL